MHAPHWFLTPPEVSRPPGWRLCLSDGSWVSFWTAPSPPQSQGHRASSLYPSALLSQAFVHGRTKVFSHVDLILTLFNGYIMHSCPSHTYRRTLQVKSMYPWSLTNPVNRGFVLWGQLGDTWSPALPGVLRRVHTCFYSDGSSVPPAGPPAALHEHKLYKLYLRVLS